MFNISDPKKAVPLGFIPTGWYPTSVRFNPSDKRIYVSNGKGLSSKSNRNGPNPNQPGRNLGEYIGAILKGTVSVIDLPNPESMENYTKQAYACSPLRKDASAVSEGVEDDNPIPRKVGDASPIKHCIYIIKENRTYDQVFGDMPQGNGERNSASSRRRSRRITTSSRGIRPARQLLRRRRSLRRRARMVDGGLRDRFRREGLAASATAAAPSDSATRAEGQSRLRRPAERRVHLGPLCARPR